MEKQQHSSINILGEGFVVDGVCVTIPTQCVISGTILQHVECLGKLVLNSSAIIRGNIKATDLVLKGSYEGAVWAKGVVTLSSTARFRGTISASGLIVEEGAYCHSDIQVDSLAADRYEIAELEEDYPLLSRHPQDPEESQADGGSSGKPEDSSPLKEKKTARKQKDEASEEVTDEIEMDRSDAPGKVADHFW
ncbi:MAG: polymer-forming cytoskeletal protein [Balneolaceae bacterium]